MFGGLYSHPDTGIEAHSPLEQAYALVFLCSEAAVQIRGAALPVDGAWTAQ